ncbi:particle associated protein [Yersinia phage fHe-Yen8-01]|nr:particle associated protein [Yersinia phage fHe-Yen8-01]
MATTLVADAQGIVRGKLTIPANVKAGTKRVQFKGSRGGNGDTTFTGQGTVVTNQMRKVTNVTSVYYDPLAQTFILDNARQLGGVEVYVTQVNDDVSLRSPLIIQLRETQVGFPTATILAEGRLAPSNIVKGAWNRIVFDDPFYGQPNIEYAVVVMCNDADTAVGISELGKADITSGNWVTSQPYQVGVLLSSSNASTWTAHQDKDLTFRLLARKYTEISRSYNMGTVNVTGATDLLISALTTVPATGADADLTLTFPDQTIRTVSDGQVVKLSAPVTGAISVRGTTRATANGTASALLDPGSQIVAGVMAQSAQYITRGIEADAAGAKVRVIFIGQIPSGSTALPFAGADVNPSSAIVWKQMILDPDPRVATRDLGNGYYEYQYVYPNTAGTAAGSLNAALARVKIELSGTASARPYVFNLRVSIT